MSAVRPGVARNQRIARWGFPAHELVQQGEVLALTGRSGLWRIYFGRGQLIELSDGVRWRLSAVGTRGGLNPLIVDRLGRKIVTGAAWTGGYGINGRDYAYRLSADRKFGMVRPDTWFLRKGEEESAVIDRSASIIEASTELPVQVVLLAFALAEYGIPGEEGMGVPRFQWGVG